MQLHSLMMSSRLKLLKKVIRYREVAFNRRFHLSQNQFLKQKNLGKLVTMSLKDNPIFAKILESEDLKVLRDIFVK